jgi:hypothetical protein
LVSPVFVLYLWLYHDVLYVSWTSRERIDRVSQERPGQCKRVGPGRRDLARTSRLAPRSSSLLLALCPWSVLWSVLARSAPLSSMYLLYLSSSSLRPSVLPLNHRRVTPSSRTSYRPKHQPVERQVSRPRSGKKPDVPHHPRIILTTPLAPLRSLPPSPQSNRRGTAAPELRAAPWSVPAVLANRKDACNSLLEPRSAYVCISAPCWLPEVVLLPSGKPAESCQISRKYH